MTFTVTEAHRAKTKKIQAEVKLYLLSGGKIDVLPSGTNKPDRRASFKID